MLSDDGIIAAERYEQLDNEIKKEFAQDEEFLRDPKEFKYLEQVVKLNTF